MYLLPVSYHMSGLVALKNEILLPKGVAVVLVVSAMTHALCNSHLAITENIKFSALSVFFCCPEDLSRRLNC